MLGTPGSFPAFSYLLGRPLKLRTGPAMQLIHEVTVYSAIKNRLLIYR